MTNRHDANYASQGNHSQPKKSTQFVKTRSFSGTKLAEHSVGVIELALVTMTGWSYIDKRASIFKRNIS